MPGSFYFFRCWAICTCDIMNFEISHSFLFKSFFYITKKSSQKCKYLKNKKSFWNEIKDIFHQFNRAFSEVNKSNFSGRWESDFNWSVSFVVFPKKAKESARGVNSYLFNFCLYFPIFTRYLFTSLNTAYTAETFNNWTFFRLTSVSLEDWRFSFQILLITNVLAYDTFCLSF